MTAIRVTEASGSNGAIQFASSSDFDGDANFVYTLDTRRLGVGTSSPGALLHAAGGAVLGANSTDVHHITGSARFGHGISGSLTRLTDGTSFIAAGSNVTVSTGSSGQITIAATGGGSTIGSAEDGDYTDGLFSSFTTNTSIGTAVDKFNEILKALAPSEAPVLDDIDCNDSGTSAKLSFGSSNSVSGYTSVSTTAGFSATDVNGTYSSSASSNNLRRAVFDGSTVIDGDLNEDITIDQHSSGQTNYVANAFKNGDTGTLKLEVNGSVVHSLVLTGAAAGSGVPGSGTASQLNSNSSGFVSLSQTGSAYFSDGTELALFKHRTGRFQIGTADQRDGWNYARVTHTVDGSDNNTNYIEWVNDDNANALAAAGSAFDTLSMTGDYRMSGVRYHTGGTAKYRVRVTNAYKNVYSTSNITFTETNCTIPNQSMPSINTGAGEDETKVLHLTGTATISATELYNGSIVAKVNVPHPLKTNLSSAGSQTISGILLYNLSNNSTVLRETFRRENYRILSGTYNTQASAVHSDNTWDSNVHVSGSNTGYADGLIFYNEKIVTPINGLNSGDFRNSTDGGSISNGPSENVNYSGLNSGIKTFYRYFQNNNAGSKTDFTITMTGDFTLVEGTTNKASSNKVSVFAKLPTTSGGFSTGWMDIAKSFETGAVADDDGALNGSLSASTGGTNTATFGTQSAAGNEYIVLKVVVDNTWTGNISDITLAWA